MARPVIGSIIGPIGHKFCAIIVCEFQAVTEVQAIAEVQAVVEV